MDNHTRISAEELIEEIDLIERDLDSFSFGEVAGTALAASETIDSVLKHIQDEDIELDARGTESYLYFIFTESERFSKGDILSSLVTARELIQRLLPIASA